MRKLFPVTRIFIIGCLLAFIPGLEAQTVASTADTQAGGGSVDTQEVHILTGHSVIINLQARLERVLVSNPAVVRTVTTSPTQLVVTANQPGSSSVILWDVTGHSRILDVNSDVDVAGLREALQQAFPSDSIQVTAEQGRIMLTGMTSSKGTYDGATKLASAYSKEVVNSVNVAEKKHGRQILLKVRFAEVDRTKLDQFGVNLLSTGAGNTIGTATTGQFSPPTQGGTLTDHIGPLPPGTLPGFSSSFNLSDLLNIFLFRPDIHLGAIIRDLQQKNVLQILAEPNLLAMNGEPAKFHAGGEFPFPIVQPGQNFNTVTIVFKPFGVQLEFTGVIEDDDVIRLKVSPEVSTLDFTNAVTIAGFTLPALSTRRAETEIELKNGQSFGIAGMLDRRTTALLNKVPGIGDVPILGQLFRSKSVNTSTTELIVIVTPTIVDPVAQASAEPTVPSAPYPPLDPKKFDQGIGKQEPAQTSKP